MRGAREKVLPRVGTPEFLSKVARASAQKLREIFGVLRTTEVENISPLLPNHRARVQLWLSM